MLSHINDSCVDHCISGSLRAVRRQVRERLLTPPCRAVAALFTSLLCNLRTALDTRAGATGPWHISFHHPAPPHRHPRTFALTTSATLDIRTAPQRRANSHLARVTAHHSRARARRHHYSLSLTDRARSPTRHRSPPPHPSRSQHTTHLTLSSPPAPPLYPTPSALAPACAPISPQLIRQPRSLLLHRTLTLLTARSALARPPTSSPTTSTRGRPHVMAPPALPLTHSLPSRRTMRVTLPSFNLNSSVSSATSARTRARNLPHHHLSSAPLQLALPSSRHNTAQIPSRAPLHSLAPPLPHHPPSLPYPPPPRCSFHTSSILLSYLPILLPSSLS